MKSLDVGTAFLVKGEVVDGNPEFTVERNAFLEASTGPDTLETLKENNWSYVQHGDNYYILGEDAIKLKNLLTVKSVDKSIVMTRVGELRRPMKDGILNTGEEKLSIAIIQKLIANLLGPPKYKGEVLCFCVPAEPVDRKMTVVFHKTMLTNFLKSLGYEVECITEAMAVIYSERPVADDPDEGEMPFSGIGVSVGGGMLNCILSHKKLPLISMSVAQAGDYIDNEAAKVAGIDVAAMTRFKETKFDLNNVDYSDMRQAALDIFYQNVIENAMSQFAQKFNQLESQIDFPLEIVVAGGTSKVPGFMNKFINVVNGLSLPFKIKNIRHAANPFYSVANGCLLKAIATENKKANQIVENLGNDTKENSKKKHKNLPND